MDTLRIWRKSRNLSQRQFGDIAGISAAELSRFERSERKPTAEVAKRIELATNGELKATELLGLSISNSPCETARPFEAETDYKADARALGLDPDAIAAKAINDAIKRKRLETWKEANAEAIESWNDLVKREGLWSDGLRAF